MRLGDAPFGANFCLKSLADGGAIDAALVQNAIERYEIDPEAPLPTTV